MNLRLQCKRNFGFILSVLLFLVVGFCCSPDNALASRGVTFSWQGDQTTGLEGYRLYYGKKSRFAGNQPGDKKYDYFLDLSAMAQCSTDRTSPECQSLDTDMVSCSDLESEKPTCVVKGLPHGLNYFAVTAYGDTAESGYSDELTGVLDKNGNLLSLSLSPSKRYAHLDATYNLLLN